MKKIISVLIGLVISSFAFSQSNCGISTPNSANKTIVIFINGVLNLQQDACLSSEALARAVDGNYDYRYFYIPTNGLNRDINELRYQAIFSDTALIDTGINDSWSITSNQKDLYYGSLGQSYFNSRSSNDPITQRVFSIADQLKNRLKNLASTYERIIVVPHSQGNFYMEAAYAMLKFENDSSTVDKIRVVGVASVAATTPNDTYITNSGDSMVYFWQNKVNTPTQNFTHYKPLRSYDTLAQSGALSYLQTYGFHNFLTVYLSSDFYSPEKNNKSYREIIKEYVQSFIVSDDVNNFISITFNGETYRFTNFSVKKMTAFDVDNSYSPLIVAKAYWPQFTASDGNGNSIIFQYCATNVVTSINYCDNDIYGKWKIELTKSNGTSYINVDMFEVNTEGSHAQGLARGHFSAYMGNSSSSTSEAEGFFNISNIPFLSL